ncbi:transcriptional regulator [Lysinibacillus sp. NPDC047702]|uniref:transcriptional regulator n=1 Tax=unclassified Lysinibacillus TaxID=2636778 RepID=UPI003CFD0FE0
MAKPKCPECKIEGLEHIVSEDSTEESEDGQPWFNVAFCNNCGHVYGIFNKYSLNPFDFD